MKQKKSPHLNPLPKGEEVNDSIIAINGTILKKLDTIENLLKKKDDKPLTFKEACAYLGYAPSYLYKLTYRKVIPHYKPTGKMIFFSKNELDEWIFKNAEGKGNGADNYEKCEVENTSTTLGIKDPNQIEMELEDDASTSLSVNSKSENEKDASGSSLQEKEIVIEFPLKSRRRKAELRD